MKPNKNLAALGQPQALRVVANEIEAAAPEFSEAVRVLANDIEMEIVCRSREDNS